MSSMMMEVSIGWHAIVVGDERPRHFQRAVQNLSQGWMPSGSSHGHHSIDIVLGLEQEVRLTRLELTVLGWTENGETFFQINYFGVLPWKFIYSHD
jgi:hypothetical protein